VVLGLEAWYLEEGEAREVWGSSLSFEVRFVVSHSLGLLFFLSSTNILAL
jgi:hypothetical protein